MIYLVISLYFFILFRTLRFFDRQLGHFNLIFIFSLMHIIYTFMIPLEILILSSSRFLILNHLNPTLYIFWSLLGFIGFTLPFRLIKKNKLRKFSLSSLSRRIPNDKYLILFIISYFIFGVLFFNNEIFSSGTYEGNIILSNKPLYKFYVQTGILILAYSITIFTLKLKHILTWIILIFTFFWSLYSSDKNPLFIIGFSFLAAKGYTMRYSSFKTLILLIIVIPVLSVAFSFFRAGKIDQFDVLKSSYSNSDPKGPFETIIFYDQKLRSGNLDLKYGTSYLKSLVSWIPQKLWNNRPDDLAVEYAKKNIPFYSKGIGLGFSPISEGLMNFGYLGPFFSYSIYSFFLLIFFTIIYKNLGGVSNTIVLYVFLIYLLLLMHRSPFNFPALIVRNFIPLVLFTSLFKLKLKIK